MKRKLYLLAIAILFCNLATAQITVFSEHVGTATGDLSIASNTFQNTTPITFSGTAMTSSDMPSTGYAGVSGDRNVVFYAAAAREFVIAGINTVDFTNLVLSFGHYKNTDGSSMQMAVEVSSDGTTWSPLSYSRSGGVGTAGWLYVSASGFIPSTSNLRIRFRVPSYPAIFRIDDIKLTGSQVVDWANINQQSATINVGGTTVITAQVYEPGITEAAGPGPGITAYIGYCAIDEDPSVQTAGAWTWIPATYHGQSGNNDVWKATLGAGIPVGIYYYASRFQLDGGVNSYGGWSSTGGGFWNPPINVNGVLNVLDTKVDDLSLHSPATGAFLSGTVFNVYGRVFEPGVTPGAGQGANIQAWIGFSPVNDNPATGPNWTWVPATYNSASTAPPNYDEYVADIGSAITAQGQWYYASRFQLGLGTYSYGGITNAGPLPHTGGSTWDGVNYVSGVANVVIPREINVKQASTDVPSGSTFFMGTQLSGPTGAPVTFTLENQGNYPLTLGSPKYTITGTDAGSFFANFTTTASPVPASNYTTFTVWFTPSSTGTKNAILTIKSDDANEANYVINLTAFSVASEQSDIITNTSFVYPENINYAAHQAPNVDVNAASVELAQFTLRDGGSAADGDNLKTRISSITMVVGGSANIRRIAIFAGALEIKEVTPTVGNDTITFAAFSNILEAADNGSKLFSVRASFLTSVTDNEQITLRIIGATTATLSPGYSAFDFLDAGGAASVNTATNKRIEVNASKLAYVIQPVNVVMYVPMQPVTVAALDVNNNRDLDHTIPVSMTSTGPLVTTPLSATPVNGLATFSNIMFTTPGTGKVLKIYSTAFPTQISSGFFDILPGSSPADYYRSNAAVGNWNDPTKWQSSPTGVGGWVAATLSPRVEAAQIHILAGHRIISTETTTADNLMIDGQLDVENSTFTLNNGAGADMQVNLGGAYYNFNGNFIQNAGATITVDGNYYHDTNSLVLPIATWSDTSICHIWGIQTDGLLVNSGQSFGNFVWDNLAQWDYIYINNSAFQVRGTFTFAERSNNNYLVLGNTAGTFTNSINTMDLQGGEFAIAHNNAVVTLNATNVTVQGYTYFMNSYGTGTGTLNVANNLTIQENGTLLMLVEANVPNQTINVGNLFSIIGGPGMVATMAMEEVGSVTGVARIYTKDFSVAGNQLTVPVVNFGKGPDVQNNAIYISGHFTKTGANTFTTTSTTAALGFVFNGTGAVQNLSYLGNTSEKTSYIVKSGASVKLLAGLNLGILSNPISTFTVEANATLDFVDKVIKPAGVSANPGFSAGPGATLITSNTTGFGGTSASGSLQNFNSLGTVATNRVYLPAGIKYIFNASASAAFPHPPANFGDPAQVIVNSGTVISNMTSQLQVTNLFAVNGGTFRLNTAGNNLRLQNAAMTIAAAGTFDNNGENQIINGGTTSTITLSGKFITRHTGGFIGTGTAIPSVPTTVNTGSTVEYGLAGNQIVQGGTAPTYHHVTFSNSGVKTLATGPNNVAGTITVSGDAVFDAGAENFGTTATNITMTGNSVYRSGGGSAIKPNAGGTYNLGVGTTMEFYNPTAAQTKIRKQGSALITYRNMIINGNDVINTGSTGIRFAAGSVFTVKPGAIFKLENPAGFNGHATTTAISNVNSPTITLEPGSAVEYAFAGDQTITDFPYTNLRVSGSGIKSVTANEIFVGEQLHVISGTLQVNTDKVLTVTDKVSVSNPAGVLDIKNSGSLVQITEVDNATSNVNVGTIKMARNAQPMHRFDYTYWGSPVSLSPAFTLNNLSPATRFDKYYSWNEMTQTWITHLNGAQNMVPGRGYIIRCPDTYPLNPAAPAPFTANFVGKPNNGTVVIPTFGSSSPLAADYKYNLISNPYPSAIDADLFLTDSLNANVGGTLLFWTHNTAISTVPDANGVYNYSNSDYATYNLSGGAGTAASPGGGPNTNVPSGNIAAGQAFYIRGITDGAATATFKNSMRLRSPALNNQFYRAQPGHATSVGIERHRIWLNLTNLLGGFSQNLTAYVEGATNGIDRLFDGEIMSVSPIKLYSIAEQVNLKIQGRQLPFVVDDLVPMGYTTNAAGQLQLAIDHFDGLFEYQDIYIEDLQLDVIHDLKQGPYNFVSEAGTFDNRFVLRYTTSALANDDFTQADGNFVVTVKNRMLTVYASQTIEKVAVYDLLGRKVFENNQVNASTFSAEAIVPNQQTLIVKTTLENGQIISRKIVY